MFPLKTKCMLVRHCEEETKVMLCVILKDRSPASSYRALLEKHSRSGLSSTDCRRQG